MGYLKPSKETSRWADLSALAAGGRPPGRPSQSREQMLSGRSTARSIAYALRSTGRSTARTREWGACSWSTARSTGPSGWPSVHALCTSVDRSGRLPEPGRLLFGTENLSLKYSKKSHKTSKISQKWFYHSTLKYKLV